MVVRVVVSRHGGKKLAINCPSTIKIDKLKEHISEQLGIPVAQQHLFHRRVELANGESIGHSERKPKSNDRRPVSLQLLVASEVSVTVDGRQLSLLVSDVCTVGQVKLAVCRQMGWKASCYAVFIGAKRANERMKVADWRGRKKAEDGKQLCMRKLALVRMFGWAMAWVARRIRGQSEPEVPASSSALAAATAAAFAAAAAAAATAAADSQSGPEMVISAAAAAAPFKPAGGITAR
ncbi:hypothetical protein LPJ53_004843 [Coemansia erecta]|uniref:Ubiquitin-like domain-containing protein n=1 Tax=Coemansia erecta TaxID=147472 RepID=A0A9W7XY61_9FUNG|nr:hypothetical protein LPJ53_004843 [Coemansia erecta]